MNKLISNIETRQRIKTWVLTSKREKPSAHQFALQLSDKELSRELKALESISIAAPKDLDPEVERLLRSNPKLRKKLFRTLACDIFDESPELKLLTLLAPETISGMLSRIRDPLHEMGSITYPEPEAEMDQHEKLIAVGKRLMATLKRFDQGGYECLFILLGYFHFMHRWEREVGIQILYGTFLDELIDEFLDYYKVPESGRSHERMHSTICEVMTQIVGREAPENMLSPSFSEWWSEFLSNVTARSMLGSDGFTDINPTLRNLPGRKNLGLSDKTDTKQKEHSSNSNSADKKAEMLNLSSTDDRKKYSRRTLRGFNRSFEVFQKVNLEKVSLNPELLKITIENLKNAASQLESLGSEISS